MADLEQFMKDYTAVVIWGGGQKAGGWEKENPRAYGTSSYQRYIFVCLYISVFLKALTELRTEKV